MAAVILPVIIGFSLAAAYIKNNMFRFAILIAADSACSALLAFNGAPSGGLALYIITGFVLNIMIMTVVPDGKTLFSLSDVPAALCAAAAIAAISTAAVSLKPAIILVPGANPTVLFSIFCILFTAGYFLIKESSGGADE